MTWPKKFNPTEKQLNYLQALYDDGLTTHFAAARQCGIADHYKHEAMRRIGVTQWHTPEAIRQARLVQSERMQAHTKQILESIQRAIYGYAPSIPDCHYTETA